MNEAFIISDQKRNELIGLDPKSAEIIRPILRGRDIKRYGYEFCNLWLINSHNGSPNEHIPPVNINCYPAIKAHLDNFRDALTKRFDMGNTAYNLRSCVYLDDFYKQKIVWGNLCLSAQYAMAEEGIFINAPSSMIVPGSEYLLAILNSKLADWFIRTLGVTRNGGYFEYKPMFVKKLPVPKADIGMQTKIRNLINQLHEFKKIGQDTTIIEEEIDNLVFNIYNLSKNEREYVMQNSIT